MLTDMGESFSRNIRIFPPIRGSVLEDQMSAKRHAQIELLAGVDLFYGCFRRELARIAALTTEVAVPAGRVVCREGDAGDEAYVVIEGHAAVTVSDRAIADVGPGGFFGEMAILDGGPRIATVTATEPMRLLVLSRREFYAVLAEVPYVAGHMLTAVGARLRAAQSALYGPNAAVGI